VEGWWDCGNVETLLETNREMLRRASAATDASGQGAAGVSGGAAASLAEGVKLEDAKIGSNVSIGQGSVVRRSRLRDCIVGAETLIEECDLWNSIVGDHARVRGVRGTVNLGDHSEVVAGAGE
jgi:glucose-1-phosphate thymidylyltransferase